MKMFTPFKLFTLCLSSFCTFRNFFRAIKLSYPDDMMHLNIMIHDNFSTYAVPASTHATPVA